MQHPIKTGGTKANVTVLDEYAEIHDAVLAEAGVLRASLGSLALLAKEAQLVKDSELLSFRGAEKVRSRLSEHLAQASSVMASAAGLGSITAIWASEAEDVITEGAVRLDKVYASAFSAVKEAKEAAKERKEMETEVKAIKGAIAAVTDYAPAPPRTQFLVDHRTLLASALKDLKASDDLTALLRGKLLAAEMASEEDAVAKAYSPLEGRIKAEKALLEDFMHVAADAVSLKRELAELLNAINVRLSVE